MSDYILCIDCKNCANGVCLKIGSKLEDSDLYERGICRHYEEELVHEVH